MQPKRRITTSLASRLLVVKTLVATVLVATALAVTPMKAIRKTALRMLQEMETAVTAPVATEALMANQSPRQLNLMNPRAVTMNFE